MSNSFAQLRKFHVVRDVLAKYECVTQEEFIKWCRVGYATGDTVETVMDKFCDDCDAEYMEGMNKEGRCWLIQTLRATRVSS